MEAHIEESNPHYVCYNILLREERVMESGGYGGRRRERRKEGVVEGEAGAGGEGVVERRGIWRDRRYSGGTDGWWRDEERKEGWSEGAQDGGGRRWYSGAGREWGGRGEGGKGREEGREGGREERKELGTLLQQAVKLLVRKRNYD